MSLSEWEKLADRTVFINGDGSRWIPDTIGLQDSGVRHYLWHLSDYIVSTANGGSIWLIKK